MFPDDVALHRARLDDAHRVATLVEAVDLADIGEKMFDITDIEAEWAGPEIDLDRDVVLVEDARAGAGRADGADGELIAWAQVIGDRAEADVHPAHRGRGLGTALAEWTEQRAREAGETRIGQTKIDTLAAARELFEQRGYEPGWDSWILRLPEGAQMTTPPLPAGITIRPAAPDEDHAVYVVVENAFNEWDDRAPRTYEQWRSRVVERPDFDRSLLLVAANDDGPVGVCFGIHYPDEGWADQVAVVPELRGRGLARSMLAVLFDELRARGERRMGLNTDSRTGALGLYLELGMVVTHTFRHWSLEL
jgi:GNAT superfamily N-acetyltransferase